MLSAQNCTMYVYFSLFVLTFLRSVENQGIINQGAARGEPYFCAPPGFCPGLPDEGGIEPRIVTPGGGSGTTSTPKPGGNNRTTTPPVGPSCPVGKVVCFAQGPYSSCGLRKINTPFNLTDGYAQNNAYPWQAFLMGPTGNFVGSGSLISPYHVLTATHKVLEYVKSEAKLLIIMGVNQPATINSSFPSSRAAEILYYNDTRRPYDNATLKDDIAIIRLEKPINLMISNSVNTICIPPPTSKDDTYYNPPQRCIVSGWGQTLPYNSNSVSQRLKQVKVNTTNRVNCVKGFNGTVNTEKYLDKEGGQICAGGEADRDACFQDGGAPLTCGAGNATSRYTVAGIVIWGKSCGKPGVYGVYTNVPHYRDWIIRMITMRIP